MMTISPTSPRHKKLASRQKVGDSPPRQVKVTGKVGEK